MKKWPNLMVEEVLKSELSFESEKQFIATLRPSIAICILVDFQWFNALNGRSDQQSFFKLDLFSNRWLVGGIGLFYTMPLSHVTLYMGQGKQGQAPPLRIVKEGE